MGAQPKKLLAFCLAGWFAVFVTNAWAHEVDAQEEGIASYYSDRFQGATTASGEPFDQQALTAAHPSLPLGTKVVVTRADTGQEVEVLINDRGPFVEGRIIDLSKRAARELGMLHRGTVPVMVTAVQ
ncbi:septal ring lytic transglycosylase RlpA family protein [Billgrantia tianxiuensis]|jgi:rare lipoprotein A|uniref:Endolytic peptidoglycan transglycosylase RlpA n=2 Tax=Gammaproteobacteria TaxID=1236 RepID=A0A6I6SNL8_9GAMM|nr:MULTISPECIES: septal ring lytic transglycosylase RlpA family protein [Halomonas]MCE8033190.1 septal ring lytic transglycosylase RlpA family protein [Halomonas sp. MCCC 1A11057]QHC48945.1 septal ring lytic transglycosylase RlpA family protein [Halomonas tianxiuensis]